MNIEQLHQRLHPKLGSCGKGREKYTHRLCTDMSVSLERQADDNWVVSVMERGVSDVVSVHESEEDACEALLRIAKEG